MEISMVLKFQLLKNINGTYTPMSQDKATSMIVGGYTFVINEQNISFDWDAFSGNEEDGIFSFETGYGFLFDDFELTDCFDEHYEELGLVREDISAEFLAQVSEIDEIHINFTDDDEEYDEIDIGFNDDEDYRINLLTLYFIDMETDDEYHVSQAVLDEYNNRNL